MLSLSINNLGKKFSREWIFRNLSYEITAGQKLLVSGGNGSGKSTLLQVLSGFVMPNEGALNYSVSGTVIDPEKLTRHLSFASPYLQLIEEFTLTEVVEHTGVYKPFINGLSAAQVIELTELTHAKHKFIKQFSSGMKQRLKLGLAILADTPLLLLDEPVSNLDRSAISWYKQLVTNYAGNRTVIVCSNAIADEHFFCDTELSVMDYKIKK